MHQQPSAMAHRPQPMQPNPPVTRNVVPASAMAPSVAPTARAPKSPAASPTVPPSSNPQLGFDGYCPVQLHDDMRSKNMRWTPGDARWGVIHRGRTYLFSGEDQQRRFLADPDRYAPVLSGNDIVLAIDKGQMVPGRREHGVLYEDHIYLFSNEGTLKAFAQNRSHYARLALQAMATDAQRQRAMQ